MRLAALFAPLVTLAAVDGTVVNKTTGKPQAGATVTLYKLGEAGMDSLETVKSGADGKFLINHSLSGPHLIQTAFDGVTYNHMLPPGAPTARVEVAVYNASSKPGQSKIKQHAILFEPTGTELSIKEMFFFDNPGDTSWNDPDNGTLRFYVPDGTRGSVEVTATAPGGMPIRRAAEKTRQAGVLKVDFPIKPGETTIELGYRIPFTPPGSYSGRILQAAESTRLIAPNGVTLKGANLESEGKEPRTQASIYKLTGRAYNVEIEGAALRPTQPDEESGPTVGRILPRLYDRLAVVLTLVVVILALGLWIMFQRGDPAASQSGKGKRVK